LSREYFVCSLIHADDGVHHTARIARHTITLTTPNIKMSTSANTNIQNGTHRPPGGLGLGIVLQLIRGAVINALKRNGVRAVVGDSRFAQFDEMVLRIRPARRKSCDEIPVRENP
jgi:hypothetical protein